MEFLWNPGNVLTRIHRRKRKFSVHQGKDIQATTSTKFLDIKYEFYVSGGGLIETNY